ncbi:MAG: ArsA family ATPase [Dehalococcoidales bacterium]|nr:MAG: ArsA family ATPase [Dehalococcoidales bacterium]
MTNYSGIKNSKIIMFTGKGGVGKTTCAAATALHYSETGNKTLAISTDATPSLSHIYELSGKSKPAMVTDSLFVNELGHVEVKEMWDRKFGRDVYGVFSSFVDIEYPEFVEFMTSVLPGLADEFMIDYIRELPLNGEFSAVVWDTAPLGQTLALLETPALLREHLKMAPRIYSKLKVGRTTREPILDILRRWEKLSAINMDFLKDIVDFTLVTIPEALAVEQLEDIFCELDEYELKVKRIIINNVAMNDESVFMSTKYTQQQGYLERIHRSYSDIEIVELPMFPYEIKGLERLREIECILFKEK